MSKTTKQAKASLKILLKPKKSDELDKLDGSETSRDAIKRLHKSGGEPLHKRDPALSRRERLKT